jgi:phosphoglycerate dehydrogenase-like enzyme
MGKPVVTYTDPPWAVGSDGRVCPALATVESEVYAGEVELRFVPASGGRYLQEGAPWLAALRGADALAIYRCRVTSELLAAAGAGLKVVGRQGVGFDNLVPELLKANGVIGFNIPDYCIDEVATHTLALLLALERRIVQQHATLAGGRFDIYAGGIPRRLRNCAAGIIGFGRIGRVVASRLRSFYGRVLACDPYVARDVMDAHGVERVELQALLGGADVVLLHCLLDASTTGIIDARALSLMRPGAYLINAARGALVNARALYEALSGGRLAGAGLDVFSPEDPHRDEWYAQLVRLPNVVVSSHRAYLSRESEDSQRRRTAQAILGVLRTGQPPAVGHLTEGVSVNWVPPPASGAPPARTP